MTDNGAQSGALPPAGGGTEGPAKSASAFRTISEVAAELAVPQHVLRFWETKFTQVRPLKRAGGRRYYRPEDVALLRRIHRLLYREGYTIRGVQKLLREGGEARSIEPETAAAAGSVPALQAGALASEAEESASSLPLAPKPAAAANPPLLGNETHQALRRVLEDLLAARAKLT